jgi:LPXTG-motif cell wall-anchored protein
LPNDKKDNDSEKNSNDKKDSAKNVADKKQNESNQQQLAKTSDKKFANKPVVKNAAQPAKDKKKTLVKTGEQTNPFMVIEGILLIAFAAFIAKFKKAKQN